MRRLVERFYHELWNQVDLDCAREILHPNVDFRGSVGLHANGRDAVCEYVSMVTTSLADYRCDIKTLVVDRNDAAARLRFSGLHVGPFLGYQPTRRQIEWQGAALFTSQDGLLTIIWVLGDLDTLRSQLDTKP
jgi:predicted ester cyclase